MSSTDQPTTAAYKHTAATTTAYKHTAATTAAYKHTAATANGHPRTKFGNNLSYTAGESQ
jgi:hypothetical protein